MPVARCEPDHAPKPCIICGGTRLRKLPLINEVSRYTRRAYPLFRCVECDFVRPQPLPYTEATKDTIYGQMENVRFYDEATGSITREAPEFRYYYRHFSPYLDLARKHGMRGPTLDIGCGAGHLLDMLAEAGYEVHGVEINHKLVAALSKRHHAYCCEISDPQLESGRFNLVTLNQVIEHVEHPDAFLAQINRICAPDGYFVFATPYLDGLMPNLLRSRWYGLGYGQHLNFFSRKSIPLLLERNGFRLVEMFVDIVDYAHPSFPGPLNAVIRAGMRAIVSLGLGDNLYVVAQKSPAEPRS